MAADVLVVIPALDEETSIDRCLSSIDAAAATAGIDAAVVVVDHLSADRTAARARRRLRRCASLQGIVMTSTATSVSEVRNDGAARAVASGLLGPDTWLLSTDADCVVPPSWISSHLQHRDAGIDGVAGTVEISDVDFIDAWERDYRRAFTTTGAHPHVHAANLGVLGSAFLSVGGFPATARAEDQALWAALRVAGHHVVADHRLTVWTDARLVARHDSGFGTALAILYGDGAPTRAVGSGR